jgi:hypothetical protein
MGRSRSIDDFIKETEHRLTKYKAVQEKFPDAKCNYYSDFSSKTVNKEYTKWQFVSSYSGLHVMPYCEVIYNFDGQEEVIKVHSSPKASRLVYLQRWHKPKTIKFSRLTINLKNNQFKDDMLNDCRAEIMKFISANPGYQLDKKHLEPRLQKLLAFT